MKLPSQCRMRIGAKRHAFPRSMTQLKLNGREGKCVSVIFTAHRQDRLRSTHSAICWVLETLFLGVKLPGCEAEHVTLFSAGVRNDEDIPPLYRTSSHYLQRYLYLDCFYGLVVRVPGYRPRGTIPVAARFPEK
jgi:hypothetical protein